MSQRKTHLQAFRLSEKASLNLMHEKTRLRWGALVIVPQCDQTQAKNQMDHSTAQSPKSREDWGRKPSLEPAFSTGGNVGIVCALRQRSHRSALSDNYRVLLEKFPIANLPLFD